MCRTVAILLVLVSLAACSSTNAYWRGDPARDAEAAKARGEYVLIALQDADSLILPGLPDSLSGINMDVPRIDSVTLGKVRGAQRDSVLAYAAAYNGPIFQEVLRLRARSPRPPR